MRVITKFDPVTKEFKTVFVKADAVVVDPVLIVPLVGRARPHRRRVWPTWLFAHAVLFHEWRA